MALRSVCLYNQQLIGIESIYTVSNGKQINIPEKIHYLRSLSRKNLLYCPCGCGSNLILVAGDRNLREQHFRLKEGSGHRPCTATEEHSSSIRSKIALKCWLDSTLTDGKLESRVPINRIINTDRKFEYTFFDFHYRIGICYWYDRVNIISDKLDQLEAEKQHKSGLYITDIHNAGDNGQYPESMMMIQKIQGYLLYLSFREDEMGEEQYENAYMDVRVYVQDRLRQWKELTIISDKLDHFSISIHGNLLHNHVEIEEQINDKIQLFLQNEQSKQRIEEENRIAVQADQQRLQNQRKAEYINFIKTRTLQIKQAEEIDQNRNIKATESYQNEVQVILQSDFSNSDHIIHDSMGNRWCKCEFCQKISTEADFFSYGGKGKTNLGTCKECHKSQKDFKNITPPAGMQRPERKTNICPLCGGPLRLKRGKYGDFMGCKNYPKCDYTASIKKK